MCVQTSEPAGVGPRPSFLTSVAPSGLEARRLWCHGPGILSWPCTCWLREGRHLSSPLRAPAPPTLGSLIFPQVKSNILCAQYEGSSSPEGAPSALGSLPSHPYFPGFKGGGWEWGWRYRLGPPVKGPDLCALELDPRPVSGALKGLEHLGAVC